MVTIDFRKITRKMIALIDKKQAPNLSSVYRGCSWNILKLALASLASRPVKPAQGVKLMRNRNASKMKFRVVIALIAFVVMAASSLMVGTSSSAAPPNKLAKPTISCGQASPTSIDISVCAGVNGAPAGFSIQWMLKSDYDANGGWPVNSDSLTNPASFCKASFSGVPGCSSYNLGAGVCTTIQIGDNLFDTCGASSTCANQPLECDTEYVFRAFAHNVPGGLNKSDWSTTITCTTDPCGGGDTGCTFTQGYWKTHGPEGCATGNNTNQWPVTSLTVGTVVYTDLQLCSIFNQPAAGNGLLTLAHQLIAAKLNIANGADGSALGTTIADADALIGGLVIPPVGSGSLAPSATSSLTAVLDSFNKGEIGPGHCQ
jgi:hypothetical protein